MSNEHCESYEGDLPVDIYFFHGYKDSVENASKLPRKLNDLGFTVICCEYIGHGNRKEEGDSKLWYSSMVEVEEVIKRSKKKVVLVGASMGGSMAITVGSRLQSVSQVFALSAAYGGEKMDEKQLKKLSTIFREKYTEENTREIVSAMPSKFGKCDMGNRSKFFLVHTRNDGIVPFSNFLMNVKMLCLPESNVLVFDRITGIGIADHMLAQTHPRTVEFIGRNIIYR